MFCIICTSCTEVFFTALSKIPQCGEEQVRYRGKELIHLHSCQYIDSSTAQTNVRCHETQWLKKNYGHLIFSFRAAATQVFTIHFPQKQFATSLPRNPDVTPRDFPNSFPHSTMPQPTLRRTALLLFPTRTSASEIRQFPEPGGNADKRKTRN